MGRKIAIFADGTGNTVGGNESNVLRLCRMIADAPGQVAIYDPGVGTLSSVETLRQKLPGSVVLIDDAPSRPKWVRCLEWPFGLLIGAGTERNVLRLYRALIHNYEAGDEIFLFGFSRGAFTARALAGIIYRCGVPRCPTQAETAVCLARKHFEACRSAKELRDLKNKVEDFKRQHAHVCNIRFLGVWDTVKSVGYMFPRNLPHTRHNPIVETVRHALALSERRSFYAPTTWGGLDGDTRSAIYVPAHLVEEERPPMHWQDVHEVWFPGDHSDVGGGYKETALADVSLHWMVNEAHGAGLRVAASRYPSYLKIVPDLERLSIEDVHDERARSRWYWRAIWWISEIWPRRDIDNEPPPPRISMLRPNPLGGRDLGPSARQTVINVHISAKRCYSGESIPWKDTDCTFIHTSERIAQADEIANA